MKCDAVIIGAGLGGLSAAVSLARRGADVVVIEQHDRVGGYASGFRRGAYPFDVSLHLVDAIGPGDPNHFLLHELGIANALTLHKPDWLRYERWPDHELRIPWQMPRYLDVMAGRFPKQRAGLERLAALAKETHIAFVARDRGAAISADFTSTIAQLSRRTAGSLIDELIDEPRLRASLELFGHGWLGLPLDTLAAGHFLVAWYSYHHYGGYYPVGGGAQIAKALADTLRRHGGTIRLNERVHSIRAERRRASGVQLTSGENIEAGTVISNTAPQNTFGKLMPHAVLPPRYLRRLQSTPGSVSAIKLWLGLDSDRVLESWPHYDTYLARYPQPGAPFDPKRVSFSLVVPRALHPNLASPNTTLSMSTVISPAHYQRIAPELGGGSGIAECFIDRAEALLPGLREAITVREIATPDTFARYTDNPDGSIYGASPQIGWCGGSRLPCETPISGLLLAGAWTRPGAGYSAVLRSGLRAAQAATKQLGRRRAS